MKKLKVVLNERSLSALELIHKARTTVQNVADNAAIFINPNPPLAVTTLAIDEYEAAALSASDGGRTKIALRNDKRRTLVDYMLLFGIYVEHTAAGNEEIVHLSGFEIKKDAVRNQPEFRVEQGDHAGSVTVRLKARKEKTMYKWEHSSDAANWISDGITKMSRATVNGLAKGVYWFRVVLIDGSGEHEQARLSVAVN
jgi:hypothetical protein